MMPEGCQRLHTVTGRGTDLVVLMLVLACRSVVHRFVVSVVVVLLGQSCACGL